MIAGDLREPVTFLQRKVTPDEKGNRPKGWGTIAEAYAKVTDVSGREFYEAQAHQALDTVTFGVRWRDDLAAAYGKDRESVRLRYQGQDYEILHLNRLGFKRDYMILKARTIQKTGD